MVVVLAGPRGVGGIAVGQQAGQAQLVAVAVDGPLARRGRVAAGGERRPARAFRAQVGETQVVLLGGVQVELEQAGLLVLGAVGQALGVDRVVGGRQRQVVGQLHVAAVATVEIEQGIDAAVFAATEHGAGVDLLLVVGVIAVLEHGADVAAFAQQVRRVLGLHVHGAAEAAIAGEHRVRSLLHLDALDHFRFDEHGALLVALEAALLRAVQGIGHVLGVAQAPDVGGLSARLGRSRPWSLRAGSAAGWGCCPPAGVRYPAGSGSNGRRCWRPLRDRCRRWSARPVAARCRCRRRPGAGAPRSRRPPPPAPARNRPATAPAPRAPRSCRSAPERAGPAGATRRTAPGPAPAAPGATARRPAAAPAGRSVVRQRWRRRPTTRRRARRRNTAGARRRG